VKPAGVGPAPVEPARTASPADNGSRDADRRQVTVLFADLSGFTALAERLDAEEVRAFQNALFERLAGAVTRYDGFVEKFVGDAVLAVFGAPIAHEDDPERACDAAIEMLAQGALLSEEWAGRLGDRVTLHVGIHTGPVVAGTLGGAAGATYAVTGDTVNTTARLLAAATPGTILVSDAAHALARHRFAFEPAGELALKGKTERIVVHRLLGALAEPGSARGLGALGLAAPFVGRADELDQLMAAVGRMQRGQAQVVSVVGDAGIGKSRLIAEFLGRLDVEGRLAGMAVRRAACSSLGEPTYGAFAALFREAYGVDAGDSLVVARQKLVDGLRALGAREEEAEAIAPVLSYVLGREGESQPEVEPEQLQRQILLAARALVERRLDRGPLLILIEDGHWADTASLDLLRRMVDQLADRPLMLLLSHRPDTAAPAVTRAAQSVIRLAALGHDETRALVAGLFGGVVDDALSQLDEFVATRAGGNPLFTEEIVRNLVAKGALVRHGDHWTCTAAFETVDVPPTLHGLLLSRVDRLPADARRLLQEAAVVGAAFDEGLLRAVAAEPTSAEAALDRLVDADLIQSVGSHREGRRYRFTQTLVHGVVYQNLLLSRRTELHERIGRALERAAGPRPERLSDLEALGHHFALSGDRARGAHYLLAAGDWARAVYANDDAIRHYGRALSVLGDGQPERRVARERLADLLALTGRRPEALAHYEAVLADVDAAGDQAGAARVQRKSGALHWEAGDRDAAGARFAAGLERLGADGDPIERAHLFQEMGRLAFRAGDNARAITWAEQALDQVASAEDVEPERAREAAAMRAQAFNTLGVALARTGRLAEAVDRIEQSIGLAEARDLLPAACRGYTNLGVLYSSLDPRRSIETCLRGLETAKKVGDLAFQSRLYANLAVAYCALTDRCEAEGMAAAQTAIDLDRRLGLLDHLAVPLIVLGQIHQCHGEPGQAFAMYEEALKLAEEVGEPQLLFPCYDGLATLYLDAGNEALAETYLAKAQEVCERAGLEPDALMVLPFLC
jgi:adenylate cyclase